MNKILHRVRKPSRYINREPNACYRPEAGFRICLAFPDAYEVGMSHLGLKILYGRVNSMAGYAAERCFAPWPDMEALLRRTGQRLSSLETGRPIDQFDVIGFSLQYELSYTNVLAMLDLANLPLLSEERKEGHPVILAGGPCAVNPAPMAPFIDAFLVGDGEEALPEILEILSALRDRPRHTRVEALARVPGVYVPLARGRDEAPPVTRRIVDSLETAFFPTSPVVAHQAVHNRVAIEIGRGCPRGCRYCQAGMIYRPLRERSPGRILELAEESLRNTGFADLSFTSLSAGDYPCLFPLIREANRRFLGQHIAVSLPSIRVGAVDRATLRELRGERKTGFTIAPEAGTERLRHVINKDISEEAYREGLQALFQEGWESLKLYFMIGLPTETDEDLEGIVRMARLPAQIARNEKVRRVNVNVSVSTFVPKPHTPFQWQGQIPLAEIHRKQGALRQRLTSRQIRLKTHQPEMSVLEAIFSRGDERASQLLLSAYLRGCRFDGWTESFRFDLWEQAMQETGMGYGLAEKSFGVSEPLPWRMVDSGVQPGFLKKEFERSLKSEITPECREKCMGCGLKCDSAPGLKSEEARRDITTLQASKTISLPKATSFRVRYRKAGVCRFLSHLELKEAFIRGLRRAGITLEYSQGFHPHPRISFGPALSVGFAGADEYLDMQVLSPLVPDEAVVALNRVLPEGIEVRAVKPILRKTPSLNEFISRFEFTVQLQGDILIPGEALRSEMPFERVMENGVVKVINLRPLIEEVRQNGPFLMLRVQDRGDLKVRLPEILSCLLALPVAQLPPLEVERVRQQGFLNGWHSPMDVIS